MNDEIIEIMRKTGLKKFGNYSFWDKGAEEVCDSVVAVPKPTKGEIKVASPLVFANFFIQVEDSPKDVKYSDEWSLNCQAGRTRITAYKAEHNVAYGQMGNTSIGIYINKAKDSIIIGPAYHPAESEEFDSDAAYYAALKVPVFPDHKMVGKLSLRVWRWEATELDTIGKSNYDKLVEEHGPYEGVVKLKVPHGIWMFEHYYDAMRDTDAEDGNHVYARLTLKR